MKIPCEICTTKFNPEMVTPSYELISAVECFFDVDTVCEPCLKNGFKFLKQKASEFINE